MTDGGIESIYDDVDGVGDKDGGKIQPMKGMLVGEKV